VNKIRTIKHQRGTELGLAQRGDPSQEEMRALMKLMPFGNAFGFMQAHNFATSGLPERPPSDHRQPVGLFD